MNHRDPFNCEYRAYGCLKEAGPEDLAALCYGYLLLDATEEAALGTRLELRQWYRERIRGGGGGGSQPLRAIVKEYVEGREAVHRGHAPADDGRHMGHQPARHRRARPPPGQLPRRPHRRLRPGQGRAALELDPDRPDRASLTEDLISMDLRIDDWNRCNPGRHFWRRFYPRRGQLLAMRDGVARMPRVLLEPVVKLNNPSLYDWRKKIFRGGNPRPIPGVKKSPTPDGAGTPR